MATYENGNKPADSTLESRLLTGQSDPRGPVGEFSRGANVYSGGLPSATTGYRSKMQPTPITLAKEAYKHLAKTYFGGLSGSK
jgi:hypothetical protein